MPSKSGTTQTNRPIAVLFILRTITRLALVLVTTLVFSGFSTLTSSAYAHLETIHLSMANTQVNPTGPKTQGLTQPIILLTGFEPFGGETINMSWEAVRQLNGLVIHGASVQSEKLPVLWHGSAETMRGLIQVDRPILIVSVGEGGPILSLETYAHNHNDSILDNARRLPDSSSIISNMPYQFKTPLDIASISKVLTTGGMHNVISNNAGGYLCNFISFNTYAYLNKTRSHVPALFVHVPPASSSVNRADISTLAKALVIILQQSMHQVTQHQTQHVQ